MLGRTLLEWRSHPTERGTHRDDGPKWRNAPPKRAATDLKRREKHTMGEKKEGREKEMSVMTTVRKNREKKTTEWEFVCSGERRPRRCIGSDCV